MFHVKNITRRYVTVLQILLCVSACFFMTITAAWSSSDTVAAASTQYKVVYKFEDKEIIQTFAPDTPLGKLPTAATLEIALAPGQAIVWRCEGRTVDENTLVVADMIIIGKVETKTYYLTYNYGAGGNVTDACVGGVIPTRTNIIGIEQEIEGLYEDNTFTKKVDLGERIDNDYSVYVKFLNYDIKVTLGDTRYIFSYGQKVVLPNLPDFRLNGIYTDKERTELYDCVALRDITVYADYERISYSVVYYYGEETRVDHVGIGEAGYKLFLPESEEFVCWCADEERLYPLEEAITIDGDVKIYGRMKGDGFYVYFYNKDGAVIKSQYVKKGYDATAPGDSAMQIDGYIFDGWSGSYENVTRTTVLIPKYTQLPKEDNQNSRESGDVLFTKKEIIALSVTGAGVVAAGVIFAVKQRNKRKKPVTKEKEEDSET